MPVRRIYSSKKYSKNPFFQKRRGRIRGMSWKKKSAIAGAILLVFITFNFLFFNEYFLISNVVSQESGRIGQYKIYSIINKQLQRKRFFVFSQQNIFSFSKSRAKKEILKSYLVNNLKIDKDLPRTLKITFDEIEPAAVWREDEQYYYVDASFNILSKIEGLEINAADFMVLKNADSNSESQIKIDGINKKVIIGEEYLLACLDLKGRAKALNLNIDNICNISKLEATATLSIADGPKIHFSVENDLGRQFKKLEVLLADKLKGGQLKRTEYIDLRFGEKIYYK